MTPELERGVQVAKEKFDETVSTLKTETLEIKSYGKDWIKTKKLSPDAYMQLAFQVSLKALLKARAQLYVGWIALSDG